MASSWTGSSGNPNMSMSCSKLGGPCFRSRAICSSPQCCILKELGEWLTKARTAWQCGGLHSTLMHAQDQVLSWALRLVTGCRQAAQRSWRSHVEHSCPLNICLCFIGRRLQATHLLLSAGLDGWVQSQGVGILSSISGCVQGHILFICCFRVC